MLYMIGLGLCDEKDITLKGLEAIRNCENVFLEGYTSLLQVPIRSLEELYGNSITLLDREGVERKAELVLDAAQSGDAAFLVIGDVFSATTHHDLLQRARDKNIKVQIIHNTSVLIAVGDTGLDLYKFGRTTTLCYPQGNYRPTSFFDVIEENYSRGLHTLCLLDIKSDEERFMSIAQASSLLLEIAREKESLVLSTQTLAVACARLGCPDQFITVKSLSELKDYDAGKAPHCLIIPGKLSVVEEEFLRFSP